MKCFYHADLDGHCAGAIVKLKFPDVQLYEINYGWKFPWDEISPGEGVFMVDFALQPHSDMERLQKRCNLTWIDHHKTAIEAAGIGFDPPGLRMVGRAACDLAWEYLFPGLPLPLAVKLLGEYDVWDHADDRTLPFQYGMKLARSNPANDMSIWVELLGGNDKLLDVIMKQGELILQYENKQNQDYCKAYSFESKISFTQIDPIPNLSFGCITSRVVLKAICCNRGNASSKLFDSVWDPDKYDIMVTFIRLASKKWTVSLYSTKPEVDCGRIAKHYGGGGHAGAAGFQCDILPFEV